MKKFLSSIVFLLIIFSSAAPVYAAGAWAAIESFDSYTSGAALNTLNGGSGFSGAWSGDTHYAIENTVFVNSPNGVTVSHSSGADYIISRSASISATTGDFYFAMRADGTDTNNYFGVDLNHSGTNAATVQFRNGAVSGPGRLVAVSDSGGSGFVTSLLDPVISGTMYVVDVQPLSGSTFRVRWKAVGGSFSAFTGTLNYRNSVTLGIDSIDLDAGNVPSGAANTYYFDGISTTDPSVPVVSSYNDYSLWWNILY